MEIHVRNTAIALLVAAAVALALSLMAASAGGGAGVEVLSIGAGFGGITFYVLWNLSGNRKIARASNAQREQALSLTPPPGQALVYIVRKGFVARGAGMDISIDGTLRAHLKAPRFTCFAVAPGKHELAATFVGGAGAQSRPRTGSLVLEAGQVVGLLAEPKMGMVQNSIALQVIADRALPLMIRRMPMMAPIQPR